MRFGGFEKCCVETHWSMKITSTLEELNFWKTQVRFFFFVSFSLTRLSQTCTTNCRPLRCFVSFIVFLFIVLFSLFKKKKNSLKNNHVVWSEVGRKEVERLAT